MARGDGGAQPFWEMKWWDSLFLSGFGVATILRAEENEEEWVRKVIGLGFGRLLGREKKGEECLVA